MVTRGRVGVGDLHFFVLPCIIKKGSSSTYLRYFQFDHFPKFKNFSESRFEMRTSIFLFNFFFKSLDQYEIDDRPSLPEIYGRGVYKMDRETNFQKKIKCH